MRIWVTHKQPLSGSTNEGGTRFEKKNHRNDIKESSLKLHSTVADSRKLAEQFELMTIFSEVKQHLPMKEVARYYGITVNRSGFTRCPFHEERTPSMKIYDDHFYCFGCQCGGDVIRFVSQLFSLTPLEAARKLQSDFGIADVEFDREQYKRDRNTRMEQLRKEKQYESWKHNTYLLLTDYCSLLREWRKEYAPKTLDEPFQDKYLESLKELEKAEYYCDLFLYGTRADLEEFKRNEERLVKRIEQRIREQN
jgi:hypothetical protein